jgi:hypothetical protein
MNRPHETVTTIAIALVLLALADNPALARDGAREW